MLLRGSTTNISRLSCEGIFEGRTGSGEGSRPRDPLLPKPSTFDNCRRKYILGFRYVLAARGDARPPRFVPAPPSFRVQDDAANSVVKTAAPSNLPLRIASKASLA
jgi:hypothetical protein